MNSSHTVSIQVLCSECSKPLSACRTDMTPDGARARAIAVLDALPAHSVEWTDAQLRVANARVQLAQHLACALDGVPYSKSLIS